MALPFSAFIPLIGEGINAISNLFTNKAQKKTALEMYDRQRTDALADWNRQNDYNTPKAQMSRFKEAGLSPHLIYGQTNTAPAVRSSDTKMPNYTAPQIDTQSTNPILLATHIENMKKQGTLMDAQAIKTNSETDWKNINTKFFKDNYENKMHYSRTLTDLNENKIFESQNRQSLIKEQTRKALADTNLSEAKKAEVSQMILNLKQSERLLGEKVKTEEYLNSIQQKLQSMGIVGSTLAQILRLFK
jgi:hypothetical protein